MNQEEGSHQTLNLQVPWPWTSSLQNVSNVFLLFLSHPAYGGLF